MSRKLEDGAGVSTGFGTVDRGRVVSVQGANVSGGSVNVDSADWLRITAMELGG